MHIHAYVFIRITFCEYITISKPMNVCAVVSVSLSLSECINTHIYHNRFRFIANIGSDLLLIKKNVKKSNKIKLFSLHQIWNWLKNRVVLKCWYSLIVGRCTNWICHLKGRRGVYFRYSLIYGTTKGWIMLFRKKSRKKVKKGWFYLLF